MDEYLFLFGTNRAFRQLPTMKERVIALGAFMRRQAYFFGPKKHGRPQDRFKVVILNEPVSVSLFPFVPSSQQGITTMPLQ